MTMIKDEILPTSSQETEFVALHFDDKHDTIIPPVTSDVTADPPQLAWSKVRYYCRDAFSEFFGTMILILFGDGVVAQVVLSKGEKGNYQSISWGWG